MRKSVGTVSIVLQFASIGLLFMPYVYNVAVESESAENVEGGLNFFALAAEQVQMFSYATLALMILSVLALSLVCFEVKSKIARIPLIFSLAALVVLILTAAMRIQTPAKNTYGEWTFAPGFMFAVIAAVQLAVAFMSILLMFGIIKDYEPHYGMYYPYPYTRQVKMPKNERKTQEDAAQQESNEEEEMQTSYVSRNNISPEEELKLYQELVGFGAITTAEFELRKRKILAASEAPANEAPTDEQ